MRSLARRKAVARRVVRALQHRYGSPRLNNKDDPLDELIFILLSQMTTGPSYERVFDRLKREMGCWDRLLTVDLEGLKAVITDAGLSNQKAPRLITIAARLHEDFGSVSLAPIASFEDVIAERYLTSLPGVGLKTAKCVMMYSLARKVLPVDTHVYRVSQRLGLLPPNTPRIRVHEALEAVVAPAMRYDYHVNAVAHGRVVCRAKEPRCLECAIRKSCASFEGDPTRLAI